MTENGTVIEYKNQFALVRIGRNSACASCGKCGMTESQKHVDFWVKNTQNAAEGDVVQLDIPEGRSAALAFVAYLLPIIPALLLMFLGFGLGWKEWICTLAFFGGLALGFCIVVVIDKIRKHKWAAPSMLKIVAARAQQKE